MQTTTSSYDRAMALPIRPQAYMYIDVEVIDPNASTNATVTSVTDQLWYSMVNGIVYDRVPEKTYATLEQDRTRTDNTQLIPSMSDPVEQGWIGSTLSNSSSIFTPVNPTVSVDFGTYRSNFAAITLTFDPTTDSYPTEIDIIWGNGTTNNQYTFYPDKSIYICQPSKDDFPEGFVNVKTISIIWKKSHIPYNRARLQRIQFGYTYEFKSDGDINDTNIQSAYFDHQVDPLSRTLPNQSAGFTIIDYDGLINLDNPQGIYYEFQQRIPVKVTYGLYIQQESNWADVYGYKWDKIYESTWAGLYGDGYIEKFPGGYWYLNSSPNTEGSLYVNFQLVSIIAFLEESDYYKGPVGGGDLYTLASDILNSARIPKLDDGSDPWYLWPGLSSINTSCPLPIKSCAHLLQLIANAAKCVMYVDREGIFHLEPMDTTQYDFHIQTQYDTPSGEANDALAGVRASVYSYDGLDEEKEISSGEYTFLANETKTIEFSNPYKNLSYVISGNPSYSVVEYSHAVSITISSPGTYEIKISGQEILSSNYNIELPVANAKQTAIWADIDSNILITDQTTAESVCDFWRSYLLNRITYTEDYHGNPELDILDHIYMETKFTEKSKSILIKHRIDFNGTFKGNAILKRMEG